MNINNLLGLYTDYLLVTPTYSTATGLSNVTGNKVSHDQVTRLLSGQIDDRTLWQSAKPLVYAMKSEIWLVATKAAWKQLDKFSTTNPKLRQIAV